MVAWISLILAGVVVWAFFLKRSDGFTRIWPTAITIATMLVNFGLLSISMRALPLGAVYVIWTGIEAVGAFLVGFGFGGTVRSLRFIAAALIIVGVILMKIATPDWPESGLRKLGGIAHWRLREVCFRSAFFRPLAPFQAAALTARGSLKSCGRLGVIWLSGTLRVTFGASLAGKVSSSCRFSSSSNSR